MPPNNKFTKEEIINTALELTRENGLAMVTARGLAARLGSSAKPIFGLFQNMEDVQNEVFLAARELYNSYIRTALTQSDTSVPKFKSVGEQYIHFSISEPKLFQLLFMKEQEHAPEFADILPTIEASYEDILCSIENEYHVDPPTSRLLYQHLFIYAHGIAVLCATRMCTFSAEEISILLTQVFKGLITTMKGNQKDDTNERSS